MTDKVLSTDKHKAKLILERWLVGIKQTDRKHDNMPSIFDTVAGELAIGGISFDVAYESMKLAAKQMYPASEVIKFVYKNSKLNKKQNLQEFVKSWQDGLDKLSMIAFYTYFKIEGVDDSGSPVAIDRTHPKVDNPDEVVTTDLINKEDFWKSVSIVSKEKPWLFADEESANV